MSERTARAPIDRPVTPLRPASRSSTPNFGSAPAPAPAPVPAHRQGAAIVTPLARAPSAAGRLAQAATAAAATAGAAAARSAVEPDATPETAAHACRTIAITSGKGGVGKSNVAANLAIAIGRLGRSVLALDADLGLANLDVIFGVRPTHTLYHVLKGSRHLRDVIIQGAPGVHFIAGGSGIRELADLDETAREQFLGELKALEEMVDVVLIDTGAGLNSNVVGFLAAAGEVLVITTPEPTAMADAYGVIKTLAAETDPMPRIWVVVNRVRTPEEGALVAGRLFKVAKQFLGVGIGYAGCLMEDPAVARAVKTQRPFTVAYPNSEAAAGIANLVSRLFGVEIPRAQTSGLRRLVERVAGVFGR